MRRMLLFFLILLSIAATAAMCNAQSKGDFTLVFTRNQGATGLTVTLSRGEVPVKFAIGSTVLDNVRLYRVESPDTPGVHAQTVPCAFNAIDPSDFVVTLWMATCTGSSPTAFPLAEGSYFLEIKAAALIYNGAQSPVPALKDVYPSFSVSKEVSAKIDTAGNVADRYSQMRVNHSDVPLSTAGLDSIDFQRITLRVTPSNDIDESKKNISASYVPDKNEKPGILKEGEPLEFKIQPHLSDGQQYLVRGPTSLLDAWMRPVKTEGKLKMPDIPKTDDDAKITGNLSMQAAVHQAAVFQLTGKFSPLTRDYFSLKSESGDPKNRPNYPDYWDPSLTVDVGLRSTKSANSIIATGLFRHWIDGKNCAGKAKPNAVLVAYQKWDNSDPTCLGDVRFAVGPRFETDRNFNRLNALGEARFDFDFYRWHGTVSDQRKLILNDIKNCHTEISLCKKVTAESDFLEGPDFGFSFVPYLEFDGGGHVNNETVTNSKPVASELVPRHGIFRIYAGGVAEVDYKRVTLKLDGVMIEMALPETIGFTTSSGVALRRVSGIQPHTKSSMDVSFDPAKHYSWNVTYENGRSAPNFEYLNKFSSGIKVVY
jgi:hypothetical protein